MTRVKRICCMHSGDHIAGDEICEEGEFPVYGGNDLRGYYPKYNCEGPMLIVGRQGALCGNVHRIDGKFWATEHALITTITHFDNLDYLYYLFTDLNFNQYVSQSAAQPGLAASKILQVETVLPPRPEQERIAAFLDERCAVVDKAIEVKRKQLESIEAIWKNLLYRATTQGIEGRDARPARPPNHTSDGGHAGRVTLPVRKRLDHRGPLTIDVAGAWYFITICAEGHRLWVGSRVPRDRNDTTTALDFESVANVILSAARWYHEHGKWRLALFLVMPDHLHLIVRFPGVCEGGHAGCVTLPMVSVIQQFKSYLVRTHGLSFQRDFFDTRLRDDAHYAEKFRYICNNPVRKGFCAIARDWPYVMAFDRETGEERLHRGVAGGHAGRVTLPSGGAHEA
ncbi:MAG: restriction endonuclease subunit S [Kiritimatiellae bacterium]|nr:restriction endonuclease subunit S [Kiritimatiellia bacterium]